MTSSSSDVIQTGINISLPRFFVNKKTFNEMYLSLVLYLLFVDNNKRREKLKQFCYMCLNKQK